MGRHPLPAGISAEQFQVLSSGQYLEKPLRIYIASGMNEARVNEILDILSAAMCAAAEEISLSSKNDIVVTTGLLRRGSI